MTRFWPSLLPQGWRAPPCRAPCPKGPPATTPPAGPPREGARPGAPRPCFYPSHPSNSRAPAWLAGAAGRAPPRRCSPAPPGGRGRAGGGSVPRSQRLPRARRWGEERRGGEGGGRPVWGGASSGFTCWEPKLGNYIPNVRFIYVLLLLFPPPSVS